MSETSIMVVEDEVIVASHIERNLKSKGFLVPAVAHSGEEAVEKATETLPHLVLMDIRLGGAMDGIQAADIIRTRLNIPVVFLTAYADDDTLKRAKVTEPFGYIIKPYEARDLHSTISIALYKHSMEKKLKESEERYALAAQGARDGLWDWNLAENKIYFSPRWKSMSGLSEDAACESPGDWFGLVHEEDIEELKLNLESHQEGHTPYFESEYRLVFDDGSHHWMYARGLVIRDEDGKAYRMAGSQADVNDRRMAEEQLLHFTFHDPLTNLSNRMIFMGILDQSFSARQNHHGSGFALLVLDIDGFRRINEKYGFLTGDQVLATFAGRLKDVSRDDWTPARLGGDEFALLCPNLDNEKEARNLGENLIANLSGVYPPGPSGEELNLSFSAGIAIFEDIFQEADQMLAQAQIAMYQCKEEGGNSYRLHRLQGAEGVS